MLRCIELARLGAGETAPNPMVGAVIVHDQKIIGEGFHREFGGPHAEVHAVNAVKDKDLLRGSTIYVSLEPCSHHGKTPPCADLIVAHHIPHVVVGSVDPFAGVAGKGIEKMRKAGIRVDVGVLEEECLALNRPFFTFHRLKRPYIILKWAQTQDGFIDVERSYPELHGKPTWISNELSRVMVHRQRTEVAAVLIGTNTALKDNPSLTVRVWSGRQPVRLVLDRQNRLPAHLHIKDGKAPTIIFTGEDVPFGENPEYVRLDFQQGVIGQILHFLYERELQSVVVEGGRRLLQSFIDEGMWDEAWVFTGPCWFGAGVAAPRLNGRPDFTGMFNDTRLACFFNNR
jgi:diaminohydroxyphosphoribosylaminopyrimidine deaminase/5-amino-6-(5-phosphoribosylamino)uracil reductase